jgi:hypothetical protein
MELRILHRSGRTITGRTICRKCGGYKDQPAPETDTETTYAPPDPYAPGIAALRTAAPAPEDDTVATRYRAERLAALKATTIALEAEPPAPPLTAADRATYAAPDPYAAGIKALRDKR